MPNTPTLYALLQAWAPLIKDLCTGAAALVASYVALAGLDTWKKQLTANAERELARRVLIAVYKVRDAINDCRLIATDIDSVTVDITQRIHEKKFEKLDEAKADLDAELLEAEAVWAGADIDEYEVSLLMFTSSVELLKDAYWKYYLSHDASQKEDSYQTLFVEQGKKDNFTIFLGKTIKRVENLLRPKLTLKQRQWWRRFSRRKTLEDYS